MKSTPLNAPFCAALVLLLAACASAPAAPQRAEGPGLGGAALSCQAQRGGDSLQMTVPGGGEIGRLCRNGACEDARFRPIASAQAGWNAEVSVGAGWSRPVGELNVEADRANFRLSQVDGVVWGGYCNASGS